MCKSLSVLYMQQWAKECSYPQRAYTLVSEHRQEVNKQVYNFSYDDNAMKKYHRWEEKNDKAGDIGWSQKAW